jgi:hypothetical protein
VARPPAFSADGRRLTSVCKWSLIERAHPCGDPLRGREVHCGSASAALRNSSGRGIYHQRLHGCTRRSFGFAAVRSLDTKPLETRRFSEHARTGANARHPLPCRRSRVRVPSSASRNAWKAAVGGNKSADETALRRLRGRAMVATAAAVRHSAATHRTERPP